MIREHSLLAAAWVVLGLLATITIPAAPVQDAGPASRTIALTFDDLPMTVVGNDHIAGPLAETQEIMRLLIKQLHAHSAPAIGFVNEIKLNVQGERDARASLLEEWLNANLLLGNHGYNHLKFSVVGLPAYEEQFLRGDSITKQLLAEHHLTQRYFRPPYMDTGNSADERSKFEALLATHHYRLAPITVENYDWMFNAPYDEACRQNNQSMKKQVVEAYRTQTNQRLAHAEALANSTFARDIPQIILLHANRLNADHLDDVLRIMEERGYHYVSIDQALSDKAYETPDEYIGTQLGSWLDRWQLHFGHQIEKESGPPPPAWVEAAYKRIAGETIGH
jgi:peptidoglycan/xylan/chitin deacetylase (PgdA/CDA1 family)